MKKTIILLASLICMMTVSAQHPADYVNPFIGTSTNVEAPSGQLTNGVKVLVKQFEKKERVECIKYMSY